MNTFLRSTKNFLWQKTYFRNYFLLKAVRYSTTLPFYDDFFLNKKNLQKTASFSSPWQLKNKMSFLLTEHIFSGNSNSNDWLHYSYFIQPYSNSNSCLVCVFRLSNIRVYYYSIQKSRIFNEYLNYFSNTYERQKTCGAFEDFFMSYQN